MKAKKGIKTITAVVTTFCMAASVFYGQGLKAAAKTETITLETGDPQTVQDALDQALENKGTKYVIKVPKGTYKMHRKLYVYSNTTLDLRGVTYNRGSLSDFGGSMIIIGTGSGGGYSMGKNITIKGGVLNAGTQQNMADLICFSHIQNLKIEGTVFKYYPAKKLKAGMKNTHMIEFGGCKNVTIKNCKFYNNGNALPNNEAVQMESLYPDQAGTTSSDFGKRDGTQCKNITIQGCYFKAFNYGCGSNHLSKKDHFSNIKFIKNTFDGSKKYAICLFGYRNVTIKGNKLKNSGSLVQNQNSKNVKVSK